MTNGKDVIRDPCAPAEK